MFQLPTKLVVGQTVVMHGGDSMRITLLPPLIDKDVKYSHIGAINLCNLDVDVEDLFCPCSRDLTCKIFQVTMVL